MKKITAFLLALIMMLSLAACGTKQEPTVSDTPDRGNTTAATENAAPATDVVRGGSLKIAKTMDMTNNSYPDSAGNSEGSSEYTGALPLLSHFSKHQELERFSLQLVQVEGY